MKVPGIIFLALVFLTVACGGSVFYFEAKYADKFYYGVHIAGYNAGGKTRGEAMEYFSLRADAINKNGMPMEVESAVFPPHAKSSKENKKFTVPMFSSGMTADRVVEYFSLGHWQDTVGQAFNYGRQGNFWQKFFEQSSALLAGKDFIFFPSVQKEAVASFLDAELKEYFLQSSPARFYFSGGSLAVAPEIFGESVDVEKILGALGSKLSFFDNSPSIFKAEAKIPAATRDKLEKRLDSALKAASSAGVTLRYKNNKWNVGGKSLATWLTVDNKGSLAVDDGLLEKYFNQTVIHYIDSPMQNSLFEIQSGKLVEIAAGKSGNAADAVGTAQKISSMLAALGSVPLDADIEIKVTEPKITKDTIDKYAITELVGKAVTNFEGGSPDRQHNIETGVSKLNGILLAPGEEFSAVKAIGEVTEEAGFVKEYVIKSNKTEKELGGGLCQIATTLFRLALNTGLPVTERINHRYVISYYGAGLDATIYGPHPDLRFINDTGNYLLLQGKARNNEVILEFYGKKDGRTVEISKPELYDRIPAPPLKVVLSDELPIGNIKCSEIPRGGVTADVDYAVTYVNGEIKETRFHSVYQPWQKTCLLGTKK